MAKILSKPNEIGESPRKAYTEKNILMKGKVIANVLNIRAQASKEGEVIGKLAKNDQVEILGLNDGWYEIKYQDSNAFVFSEFIEELVKKGIVNSNLLNIRSLPNKDSDKIDQITKDTEVVIVDETDGWYKIKYKDGFGYVFGEFVTINGAKPERMFLVRNAELFNTPLEPSTKLDVAGNRIQTIVASTYNKFGNLIEVLSNKLGIDLAAAIAVFSVESGGVGIKNGKIIIRFENHLFYRYWGKDNVEVYNNHFKFGAGQNWLGHQFRKDADSEWVDFHGDQDKEHEVLNFARSLDNEKACLSISMGLPQILGSNSKQIGYETAVEMFDKFTEDIKNQVFGFFDLLSPQMISFFRSKDFVKLAEYYNGKGQAQKYGRVIQDYYNAFQSQIG